MTSSSSPYSSATVAPSPPIVQPQQKKKKERHAITIAHKVFLTYMPATMHHAGKHPHGCEFFTLCKLISCLAVPLHQSKNHTLAEKWPEILGIPLTQLLLILHCFIHILLQILNLRHNHSHISHQLIILLRPRNL